MSAQPQAASQAFKMVIIGQHLEVTGREEWRAWLAEHHATAPEIWLIHYKKHTGQPTISHEEGVEEALCFGWIDGVIKRIDEQKYAVRYSPRRSGSVWSQTNIRRAKQLMKHGRMTAAGKARIREAHASGEWHRTRQQEQPMDIPPDLQAAVAADRQARENFDNLAPSHIRQFLRWINDAKRAETRRRRIRETVRMVREGRKPGI
jgi:uncharacterized protein YdeI (YjbR/CyaY-like superfamily)